MCGGGGEKERRNGGAFLGEAVQKCEGRKRDGVRDRLQKERGHVREREREKERWYWVEVDAGQWRCRWPINLGFFLPSYCVFLLARD